MFYLFRLLRVFSTTLNTFRYTNTNTNTHTITETRARALYLSLTNNWCVYCSSVYTFYLLFIQCFFVTKNDVIDCIPLLMCMRMYQVCIYSSPLYTLTAGMFGYLSTNFKLIINILTHFFLLNITKTY